MVELQRERTTSAAGSPGTALGPCAALALRPTAVGAPLRRTAGGALLSALILFRLLPRFARRAPSAAGALGRGRGDDHRGPSEL